MKLFRVVVKDLRALNNVISQLILYNLPLQEAYTDSNGKIVVKYYSDFSAYDLSEDSTMEL